MISPVDQATALKILRNYYKDLIEEAGGGFYSSSPRYLSGRWTLPPSATKDFDGVLFVDFPVTYCAGVRTIFRGTGGAELCSRVLDRLRELMLELPVPSQELAGTECGKILDYVQRVLAPISEKDRANLNLTSKL